MYQQLGRIRILLCLIIALSCGSSLVSQIPHKFSLSQFGHCPVKGRIQECDDDPITRQVLAGGKSSIPVLISQLTETMRTKEPVIDFWSYTTSGDVAFFFLTDLFTDKDWQTSTMPGIPNWEKIMSGCKEAAEPCWRKYIRKNGIRSVQQAWQVAWETNRDRVVWDPDNRCFRLRK